ncbi:hypothetical protein HPB47_010610, partial [Ixodes persulcatus]
DSSVYHMDVLFDARELEDALSGWNCSSSLGPDGIIYSASAHLGNECSRERLLKLYN